VREAKANILIVDDQLDNLRTLSAILSGQGYKVRKAISGELALETVRSQLPHLILLDIKMPQMDGYEVCSTLKAAAETREIPVIFLSASDEVADKIKAFAVGGADYIIKPFQAEEVLLRIGHQLTIRQQQRQLIEQNHQLQLQIQERQRVEEAMRQSEERYRAIVEDQTEFICRFLPDTTIVFVNEAYCRYFGKPREELIGNSYQPIIFEEDREKVAHLVNSLSWKKPVVTIENRVVVDGEVRWMQWNNRMIFDEQEHFIEFQSVGRDITQLKRTEEALRESEERFRNAFDYASTGMALIGLDERWLKVNGVLCDLLSYSDSQLLKTTSCACALIHPEDVERYQNCTQEMLVNERHSYQLELRYCCKSGRIIWVLLSMSLVRDTAGKPLYYVAQIQDITERRAIDQMKNEFISIVSHELRTPLTAIRGSLGLLATGIYDGKPEKAKRMLEIALTDSDRLTRLVNDILDLERLDSGRVTLVKEFCDADKLMRQAGETVQAIADSAGITLCISPISARVWAAPDAIIQTLTNLLSNAIKFSPPNSTISLTAYPQPDCLLFQVQDQGRGIPADKLETIFGRFQQVDVSDSRSKGGTGLGLAICQSIVQQHGGRIWVESTLEEGSTFYFTLPGTSE
jgi:PAS domain S-box-containing protein